MTEYMKRLRAKIGNDLLEIPAVSLVCFDQNRRVLLVRHSEGNHWTIPGGMVEPFEVPADAAVREMWEETGLHVELARIIGVFGGPEYRNTYRNGDQVSWVTTVFEGRILSGEMRPDGSEILETRFFSREEIQGLGCRSRVAAILRVAFEGAEKSYFAPPTWRPSDPGQEG